MITGTIIMY